MGYSFFLFTKLHDVIIGKSSETYDIQYEGLYIEYNRYIASRYNDMNVGEYECMLDYLTSIKADRLIILQ